jgi:hypothetical protein
MTEQGKQFTDKPWSYTHHTTARKIVEEYGFPEGNLDGMTGLEYKTKSAFHEPLPWASGPDEPYPRSKYDEEVNKHIIPGWTGHLGEMIQKEGYKEDYNNPITLCEDHPQYGKCITDGMHRVAVMYKLHPDQIIRVRKNNWANEVATWEERQNKSRKERQRAEQAAKDRGVDLGPGY